jgi:uncharacterized membrane protein YfcA
MTAMEILALSGIGLAGGLCGGLLGIGGSIVMIPLLTLVEGPNQQLYQAACMIANVVTSASAVWRHAKSGSVRTDIVRWTVPVATIAVLAGVLLSNRIPGATLKVLFGCFLLYVAANELIRVFRRGHDAAVTTPERVPPGVSIGVGTALGGIAGLLGVGGGVIAVPLLRTFARLPLRQAIGTSTATIIAASAVGAVAKNLSLPSLTGPDGQPLAIAESLRLAACLAVPALLGAQIGAALTYRLPLTAVRIAFGALLAFAGLNMTGLLG